MICLKTFINTNTNSSGRCLYFPQEFNVNIPPIVSLFLIEGTYLLPYVITLTSGIVISYKLHQMSTVWKLNCHTNGTASVHRMAIIYTLKLTGFYIFCYTPLILSHTMQHLMFQDNFISFEVVIEKISYSGFIYTFYSCDCVFLFLRSLFSPLLVNLSIFESHKTKVRGQYSYGNKVCTGGNKLNTSDGSNKSKFDSTWVPPVANGNRLAVTVTHFRKESTGHLELPMATCISRCNSFDETEL